MDPFEKFNAIKDEKENQRIDLQADQLEQQLEITEDGKKKTGATVFSFLKSYIDKPAGMDRREWLLKEFKKYPELWAEDTESAEDAARSVVDTIDAYAADRAALEAHRKAGKSRDSWIARRIERGAALSGAMGAGEYAGRLESAIDSANRANFEQIYTKSGAVNMQRNLDGFIAEQYHVNTFNLDAATKNKPYHAEVLLPADGAAYGKNSVDIVIKNTLIGKIERRYQAKYGADAEATATLFENGDYRGQRRLVPAGQTRGVERSTDVIEIDGCKSSKLSKTQAKKLQERAQEQERVKQYKWDQIDKLQAAKAIGKQVAITAALAAGFQGARILGRRFWNTVIGKKNPAVEADIREFTTSAITSGATAGVSTALGGALTIAAKSGWLGGAVKHFAKGNAVSTAACIGMENAKTLYRYGKGEINEAEALDAAGDSAATCVGGIYGSGKGAVVGSGLGSILGPVGMVIGGVAGGIAGSIVGSQVGHTLFEAGKKVAKNVCRAVAAAGDGFKKVLDFLFG